PRDLKRRRSCSCCSSNGEENAAPRSSRRTSPRASDPNPVDEPRGTTPRASDPDPAPVESRGTTPPRKRARVASTSPCPTRSSSSPAAVADDDGKKAEMSSPVVVKREEVEVGDFWRRRLFAFPEMRASAGEVKVKVEEE